MKKIILPIFILVGLGAIFYYQYLLDNKNSINKNNTTSSQIKIVNNNIDLGEIPMDEGKVNIPFEFINTGDQDIILGSAETSCMCTEGFITDINGGDKSSIIKISGHGGQSNLKRVVKPNEKVILTAVYDPNAHGPNATGPISRNIYINTNSSVTPKLDFRFIGDVVKTRTNNKTQKSDNTGIVKELFTFEEKSFYFGTIKQSGGKVKHDFKFTYNGKEPIKITGVPTSCACTSAIIDKTELQPGETGILTVKFNPNLHEEPKGKFFKTVSLLTDKKLEEIPEVKIWTEIDLDLGPEAFELKSDHDDSEEEHDEVTYYSITPEEFDKMFQNKDFFLVDTHIPEQEHIDGTDKFIPYNEIGENLSKLPKDKDAKIVLYCRSGSMSRASAYILAEHGYTNVYDLVGGKIGYDEYKKGTSSEVSQTKVITLNAKRWEYDKKEIRVKKGEKLIIKVNNTDTTHGIAIPEMKLIGDTEIEIDTSKTGEFEFRCANYCGAGHQEMIGKLIIE